MIHGTWHRTRFRVITLFAMSCGFLLLAVLGLMRHRNAYWESVAERAALMSDEVHWLFWRADLDGHFPPRVLLSPNGEPLLSWRARIARLMTAHSPEFDWESAWNAEQNLRYAAWAYARSGSSAWLFCFEREDYESYDREFTNVFALDGPGTAFDPSERENYLSFPNDLLVLIEARGPRIHWAEPGDIPAVADGPTPPGQIQLGTDAHGFLAAFADGEVWYLRNCTPWDRIMKLATVPGARENGREQVLGKYLLRRYPSVSATAQGP